MAKENQITVPDELNTFLIEYYPLRSQSVIIEKPEADQIEYKNQTRAHIPSKEEAGYEETNPKVQS
ncbi:MAG: hypothetical protein K8R53_04350 [Bacteroidales bacterium]|nr:hypothetical protein [Bacteroidales bacterium]